MKTYRIIVLAFTMLGIARAQDVPADSVKTYQAPEVVVTATRSTISEKDAPAPTEVLGMHEIQSANGGTIADLLEIYSGAWMKEYGAEGALKTISLRGSASEHVLVLVDGNRFTSFQNGLVDLNLLPLENVERVEVLHGGASALYGADALGGVVNIITRPPGSDVHVGVQGSIGSYDYQRYAARIQGGMGILSVVSGYSNEGGRDNYPFVLHRPGSTDTSLVRTDADFRKEELYLNGNAQTDDQSAISFSIQDVRAHRGAPGPIYLPTDFSLARQNDNDVNIRLAYRDTRVAGAEFLLSTGYQYSFETYVDPIYQINSYYKNLYLTANPQVQVALGGQDRLIAGGEFAQGVLYGNDFGARIQRNQVSLYFSNEYTLDFDRTFFDRMSFYETVRYDDFTDAEHALTPKIGINVRIMKPGDLRVRASYGQSYRVPTFNDLYYPNFSNPALKPEHSTSFDAGVLASASLYGEHSVELTYFTISTTDRILLDPATYIPVNIGKTSSQGIESFYRGRFMDGILELELNYTLTDARKKNSSFAGDSTFNKQLTLIPQNLFKGSLSLHLGSFTANVFRTFAGIRFTSEDNSQSLPAYSLTGVNVSTFVPFGPWKASLKLEVSNLFNVDYQALPNYPMPGRTLRFEGGIQY